MASRQLQKSNQADAISLQPYESRDEYKQALQYALEKGYGVILDNSDLDAAAKNIDQFLRIIL